MRKKSNKKIYYAIIPLLIIAFIIGVIAKNNSTKESESVYLYIGEYPVSEAEYNFYYSTYVNSFVSLYGNYLSSIGLDFSEDLYEQECYFSNYETWGDCFSAETANLLHQSKTLYWDAQNNDYKYDYSNDYKNYKEQLKQAAIDENLTTKETYISYYGNYANEKNIKKYFKEYITAINYKKYLKEQLIVTDEEIIEYYENNKTLYDVFSYKVFVLNINTENESTEELYKTIENQANDIIKNTKNIEEFNELPNVYLNNENISYYLSEEYKDLYLEDISTEISDVIKNAKTNDIFIQKNENNIKIIFVTQRKINSEAEVTLRHILISHNAIIKPTDRDYTIAFNKASEIYEEYLNSDKREEDFSRLATLYSEDIGSNTNGGLLENISINKFGSNIKNWIDLNTRKYGDCEILKSELGYHIIFFIKKYEDQWMEQIKNQIVSDKLDDNISEIMSQYPIS